MDERSGADRAAGPRHTPGPGGYLLAWLASLLAFALLLPLLLGVDGPGDYAASVLVVGYYAAIVSLVVAPLGLLVVHALCWPVASQAVHVLAAGAVGFLVVLVLYLFEPDPQTLATAFVLGLSMALGRLAVVPLVPPAGRTAPDFPVDRPR